MRAGRAGHRGRRTGPELKAPATPLPSTTPVPLPLRGIEGSSPAETGDGHGQGGNEGRAGGGGEEGADDGARGGPEFNK